MYFFPVESCSFLPQHFQVGKVSARPSGSGVGLVSMWSGFVGLLWKVAFQELDYVNVLSDIYNINISFCTIYIYSWPCMVLLSNDPLQCEFHPKLLIWYLCDHQLGSVVHHRTPGVHPIHLQLTQNHTLWKRSPWKTVYLPLNLRRCTGKCD